MTDKSYIADNIKDIKTEMAAACIRAGRDPEEAKLIAVSKTKPVEDIKAAYEAGIRDFGENHVKELLEKEPQLPSDIRWHLIGHLQTNKVRSVIGKTYLIHSVDSLKLAEFINKESERAGVVTDCLLEINVEGEVTKHGFPPVVDRDLLLKIGGMKNIKVLGLMTVAPAADDPEEVRGTFRKLKDLSVDMARENIDNVSMTMLSMGMSGDFMTACEEGASYVRVGSKIFGAREIPM